MCGGADIQIALNSQYPQIDDDEQIAPNAHSLRDNYKDRENELFRVEIPPHSTPLVIVISASPLIQPIPQLEAGNHNIEDLFVEEIVIQYEESKVEELHSIRVSSESSFMDSSEFKESSFRLPNQVRLLQEGENASKMKELNLRRVKSDPSEISVLDKAPINLNENSAALRGRIFQINVTRMISHSKKLSMRNSPKDWRELIPYI